MKYFFSDSDTSVFDLCSVVLCEAFVKQTADILRTAAVAMQEKTYLTQQITLIKTIVTDE